MKALLANAIKLNTEIKPGDRTRHLVIPAGVWTYYEPNDTDLTVPVLQRYKENFDRNALELADADGKPQIPLNCEHFSNDEGAPGWIKNMEVSDEGMTWEIEWTDFGVELVRKKRYQYVSPELLREWEHPRTRARYDFVITAGALTNTPFLKGQPALVLMSETAHGMVMFLEDKKELWKANRPNFPLHEEMDREWDGSAAEGRIRTWATEDGEVDFAKYRKAFLAYNAADAEKFGSYKLPVCDVFDGEPHVIRRGVMAAHNALSGARGGVDLPDAVKAQCDSIAEGMMEKFEKMKGEMDMTAQELGQVLDEKLKPVTDRLAAVETKLSATEQKVEGVQLLVDDKRKTDEAKLLSDKRAEVKALMLSWRFGADGAQQLAPAHVDYIVGGADGAVLLDDNRRQAFLDYQKQNPPANALVKLSSGAFTGGSGTARAGNRAEAVPLVLQKMSELERQHPNLSPLQLVERIRESEPDLMKVYEGGVN